VPAGFRYHREQGGEKCPVQLRAARPVPLQYGDLVAQDQDLGDLLNEYERTA
jgi:hypothetical protein